MNKSAATASRSPLIRFGRLRAALRRSLRRLSYERHAKVVSRARSIMQIRVALLRTLFNQVVQLHVEDHPVGELYEAVRTFRTEFEKRPSGWEPLRLEGWESDLYVDAVLRTPDAEAMRSARIRAELRQIASAVLR